jgi:hypothetical protein
MRKALKNMQSVWTSSLSIFGRMMAGIYFIVCIAFGAKLAIAHLALPMDFGSFLASGQMALDGNNPYGYDHALVFNVPIHEYNLVIPSPNLNPPISIPLFKWIAIIVSDPVQAAIAWKLISFCLYLVFLYLLARWFPQAATLLTVLWAISLAGFWQTTQVGQLYIPLLFLCALAWQSLEKGNVVVAGICMGLLISIKPQFVFWPIFLLMLRQTTAFIISAITGLLISIVPIVLDGVAVYKQWIDATLEYNGLLLPGNMSVQALLAHLGLETLNPWASLVVPGCLLYWVWINKPPIIKTSLMALLAMLLVSPYSWSGYSLFLLPHFFSTRVWNWKTTAAACLLCFPFAFVLEYFASGPLPYILSGWIYGWAIVILLWNEVTQGNTLTSERGQVIESPA